MAKYRKKPVEIEAVQFLDTPEQLDILSNFMEKDVIVSYSGISPVLYIHTLEGVMSASVGDFIIRGIKGEYYPCKPNIFEDSYDKI